MFPDAELDPVIEAPPGIRTDWDNVTARVAALRGLMEVSGPLTHQEAATRTGMKDNQAAAGLEALEGEGIVLRGKFRAGQQDVEWCHRRLLARIHRLTMDGLRKQIQPVSAETFLRFLTRHHGLVPGHRRAGANGLFEVISMLQGLDIAALSWERDILPSRLEGFRTQWLDELCLSGEVGWQRLFPPKRDGSSTANLIRVVPVSLFLREDLNWLVTTDREDEPPPLSTEASLLFSMLQAAGAAFATDLSISSRLPPTELANALGELVAIGAVTADGFGGLRALLSSKRGGETDQRRTAGMPRRRSSNCSTGRWSVARVTSLELTAAVDDGGSKSGTSDFPPPDRVEEWAWLLLRRWGVVFRDLLDREAGAPRWWQLLQIYRRLEARGEIRGGRFVDGVSGEQFAMSETVRKLRTLRDESQHAKPREASSVRDTAALRDGFLVTCGLTVSGAD